VGHRPTEPLIRKQQDMTTAFSLTGCTALITGASSGLGAEFARQLAGKASCLLLAARSEDALQELATKLTLARPELQVIVCPCDLSTDAGRTSLWQQVSASGASPLLLINNAGLGDYGAFMEAEESRIRQQIEVNITALTLLTRHFAGSVQASADQPAAVLNVSSLASVVPVPDLSVYAATKAYVTSLTEGLALELKAKHIQVMAVCPGPTPTNFGANAKRSDGVDIDRGGQDVLRILPTQVVAEALQGLEAGSTLVFPGILVSLAAFLFRLLPRPILRVLLNIRYQKSLRNQNAPTHV
jgi:uncharacterized protein